MLEHFSLVGRRGLMHNRVDWDKHFIVTKHKEPTHVVLNVEKLRALSEVEAAELFSEIIGYISG